MNADRAAILYYSIKTHYTTPRYNAITYNFKIKTRPIPTNYYTIFEKLSRNYKTELKYFYIAVLFENPKIWIGELLTAESEEIYVDWKKRMQSLRYEFTTDIENILENYKFKEIFKVKNTHPILLKLVLQKKICVDTLLILESVLKYFNAWDKMMEDDVVWVENRNKFVKYRSFMNYDIPKFKKILVDSVNARGL